MTTTLPSQTAATLADRLERAAARREPCAPVRDVLGDGDVLGAYAVQQELTRRRLAAGGIVTGRKIGLTSPAVQAQLGVDQPDTGVLFADMDATGWPQVPARALLQPKAEAEVAFVLAEDLEAVDGDELSPDQLRAAVAHACAAIEIVDSRVADWDIAITDTIADNGSSGLYVLGETRLTLDEFAPADVQMELFANGVLVSEGNGAACLGDPLNALLWLARMASSLGQPLRAGEVILSGALGPMVPAPPGTSIRAELSALGTVSAQFAS